MAAQAGQFLPVLAAVRRFEYRGIFDSGVNRVGIRERRLKMPHALKLPRMLRAIVELVCGERCCSGVVDELVALALRHTAGASGWLTRRRAGLMPRFAAIIGALDHLPEPAARLRSVDAIRISGRSFQVIELPAREMGSADVPLIALAIC